MDDEALNLSETILKKIQSECPINEIQNDIKNFIYSKPKPPQESIQKLYSNIFEDLLSFLKDPEESCNISLKINNELLTRCSDISVFLPKMLPKLTEIATEIFLESEAIHETIGEIIYNIISVTDQAQISVVFNLIIILLFELLENSFKDIKAKSCKCISVLCKMNPLDISNYESDIIDCLILCIKHPDHNVRMSSLEALGNFIYAIPYNKRKDVFSYVIGSQSLRFYEIVQFNINNIFNNLANDGDVQVRDMFYRVVADWIMQLSDKAQHIERLIPVLLNGLFDPIEEIRETCWEQINEIGVVWEGENTAKPPEGSSKIGEKPYPWHPFVPKLRVGIKLFFHEYFMKNFKDILEEISNFMSQNREFSVKIMLSLMILSEVTDNETIKHILSSLLLGFQTQDTSSFLNYVNDCFYIIGRHSKVNFYLPIILSKKKLFSFSCITFCSSAPSTSFVLQTTALTHLIKGGLDKENAEDVVENMPRVLKIVKMTERSKGTLAFVHELIESYSKWPLAIVEELFGLLIQHDHDSVPNYIEKIKKLAASEENFKLLIEKQLTTVKKSSSDEFKKLSLTWLSFMNLCKHCSEYLKSEDILTVFFCIFNESKTPLHVPSLKLLRQLKIYTPEVISKIITRCLNGKIKATDISSLRKEALLLLKSFENHNVEMWLFEALSYALDDANRNVQVDVCNELHRQFTFVKIYGIEKFTKAKDQTNIITKLMVKLINLIDKNNESSVNVLYPLIDIIGLFPEEIDLHIKLWNDILGKLVKIVVDEDRENITCKELAHLCIIAVSNSSKPEVIDELNKIAGSSDQKTADYIKSMLSQD